MTKNLRKDYLEDRDINGRII